MNERTRFRLAFVAMVGGAFVATACAVLYRMIDGPYWTGGK